MFLFTFLTAVILGGGAAAGYIASIAKRAPDLNLNAITNMAATTKVYDADHKYMFDLQGDGDREIIKSLTQVSPYVTQAFIAAEDKDFRSHFGINPLAMARAAVQNFLGHGIVSGASTITQQTIKNAIFPEQDRTMERKIQESYLAIQLEKKLTKDEILVTYLNWIYFGKSGPNNLYGIEAASKAIFGVSAKDLNLAQSTILASLPNNPTLYNPYQNLENTQQRQEYILTEMQKAGYITQAQHDEARRYDVAKALKAVQTKTAVHGGQFAHLNPEIETQAAEQLMATGKYDSLDDARQALFRGGYSIYTTINTKMQDAVNKTINNPDFYMENQTYTVTDNNGKSITVENAMEQAGATLIDNKTGRILAMGGGRDYEHDQVNHATQPRQPGSTMKPLAVYGPALDMKLIGSGTAIDDVPTVWPDQTGRYFPMNWDNRFHGLMTVRTALEQSYNIPALKVFQQVTPKTGLDYVKKMGVTTLTDNDNNLAAAIGGLSQGLTVTEATSAYTTFPNAGVHKDAYMIEEIKDRFGNDVYKHKDKETQVLNPNADYILNDMLQSVVKSGTAATDVGGHFPGYAIGGKTGTTNAEKDAWFIGYTPDVTLGIWVGYNLPYTLPNGQGHTPQRLWSSIMTDVMPMIPKRTTQFFDNPGEVKTVSVCSVSGKLPTDLCKSKNLVVSELFQVGADPHDKDDVVVKAKYYEINGKKYLATDTTPSYLVKEGIFYKRDKYTLPDNDKQWTPLDADMELPSDKGPYGGGTAHTTSKNVPTGLKVTASTTSSVGLSWNAVEGAKGYVVLRADSEAGPFQLLNSTKATSYTDNTVQANKTYTYKVVSTDKDDIQSDPSNSVTVTPGQVELSTPSDVNVAPAAVGVTISWSPVNGATSYNVYRSQEQNGTYQKFYSGADTSFTDIGALPGATFYYKVTAEANGHESAASQPVNAPTNGGGDQQDLQAPKNISVSNPKTGNSLEISWSSVNGATGYKVERSTDASNWSEVSTANGTSFTDTGLTTGQRYFYRIKAIGQNEVTSDPSQTASASPTK
ncbi:MAG: transglycosylase domain-containing protein [Tumebacillaceae bacterium]